MKGKDFKKEDYVLLAKLAQQTQRYEQMVTFADQILLSEQELTPQERNLCSSAYKSVVASRRAELKVIQALKDKNKDKAKEGDKMKERDPIHSCFERYKSDIEKQLTKTCHHIIRLIAEQVLKNNHQVKGGEAFVFFTKMLADFNRYLCQFPGDGDIREFKDQAEKYYRQAQSAARQNLPQTNPVRLSLHLNMSVFLYQICEDTETALNMANRAFEQAIANIDTVNEQNYKQCTMILQLIRDNISLWSGEEQ